MQILRNAGVFHVSDILACSSPKNGISSVKVMLASIYIYVLVFDVYTDKIELYIHQSLYIDLNVNRRMGVGTTASIS